jgi:hypothetical protein
LHLQRHRGHNGRGGGANHQHTGREKKQAGTPAHPKQLPLKAGAKIYRTRFGQVHDVNLPQVARDNQPLTRKI